jgi:V/A-type H+-transporting ATPase subunit I
MERVEVFLMRRDLQKVLRDLQGSRLIQSIDVEVSRELKIDPVLLDLRSRLERIQDLLAPLEPSLKGLKGLLKGGMNRYRTPEGNIISVTSRWLGSTEKKTKPLESSLKDIEDDMDQIDEIMSRLTTISGLDVDIQTLSQLKRVRVRLGTTRRFDELKKAVENLGGHIQDSLLDRKEGLHSVRITYASSVENKMIEALRGRVFTEMTIDIDRITELLRRNSVDTDILNLKVDRLLPRLENVREMIESRHDEIRDSGAGIAEEILPPLRAYMELVEMEIERETMGSSVFKTRYTARVTGWVERERLQELKDILTTRCRQMFHLKSRPPQKEEIEENRVPTKLKNSWLGRMFEPLTNTFAVPRYDEIDPSIWISLPFILFFGLMLGDAGYGFLIMIVSSVGVILIRNSPTMRMTAWMGFLMGLATTLSGIWMGAFFGDLIPRVILGKAGAPLFTFELLGYQMPYDTLKDPMLLFQISLYIGLAQLNIGIILLGIDRILKKDFFGFIKGTISWILIQTGGVIFVGALLIGWWELNGTLTAVGGVSFVAGALLLALEAKGMVLFDIEGFVGDWISYTRILALGLSTFGLAMAFNIVGKMLVDASLAMIPVVVLLLILLHIFNLLLQALGAAVHSLRLQFVEFFGRFYEGGGRSFEPYGMERIHTRPSADCSMRGGDEDVC